MCSCSCAPGACRTYFHKLLTICYAWHKHKSQRGYEQRASELRASDMSKIMTQRIIAIKREKSARKRTSRRACYVLCALWLLQGYVESACSGGGYYVPAFTTHHTIRSPYVCPCHLLSRTKPQRRFAFRAMLYYS